MKKRVLTMLLCVLLVVSMLPVQALAATVPETTEIDGVTYYQLTTADELYWFAGQVNKGYYTINAIVMNDITVNTGVLRDGQLVDYVADFRTWEPIGNHQYNANTKPYPTTARYKGIFDGNGKTISGLYCDLSAKDYVGFFGDVDGGTIKNLTIVDSYFGGRNYVGGIVGYIIGTVTNCTNGAAVVGRQSVGGITGHAQDTVISDCHNSGAITATYTDAAGIACFGSRATLQNCSNSGNITARYTACGVMGTASNSTATDCHNTGTIHSEASSAYGIGDGDLTRCYNTGTVSGTHGVAGVGGDTQTDCYNTGNISGTYDIGGVADSSYGATNCYNTGDITGEYNIAGVVNYLITGSVMINCYNTGDITGTEDSHGQSNIGGVVRYNVGETHNCYNTGAVTGTGTYIGGVAAYNTGKVENSYFDSDVYDGDGIGYNGRTAVSYDAKGKETAAFRSGEVAYLLGEAFGQNIDNGEVKQDAPVLGGATVYQVTGCDGGNAYSNTNAAKGHVYENGICTICGDEEEIVLEETTVALIGNVQYDSLEDALDAAAEMAANGEEVEIILTGDIYEPNANWIVEEGIILNIGNFDLTVRSLILLEGSQLNASRYSSSSDYGRVFVAQNRLVLPEDAPKYKDYDVIPMWDPVQNCYILANMKITDGGKPVFDLDTKTISFAFAFQAGGSAKNAFLMDGTSDNAMDIVVRLQWESENGVAYQDFVYKNEYVAELAKNNGYFTFELTGYDILNIDLETFTIRGMVLCDSGVIVSGPEFAYEG